ncbi:branched-chain amino acid ABC transporter substrate-binding protein [Amycolatopsis sp. cg5]|uniref:branched-chain amino acid ABC transporter substrate-binding protein n=1 Tax=Amycolatopsis sp. cg5 TaxID=3238802 RepID=UPI003523B955
MEERVSRSRVIAAALVISLVVSGCGTDDPLTRGSAETAAGAVPKVAIDAADPRGDGLGQCAKVAIAYAGTINGENAALGQNIFYGVDLAVQLHNRANPGCQVELKRYDTEGKAEKAPGVVNEIVGEKAVLGVVGPSFSGEAKAVGNLFDQAGLVQITPSATNSSLTTYGWKTFFRGLGSDAAQAPAAAKFLTGMLKAAKVCVVADDTPFGVDLGKSVTQALAGTSSCTDRVKTKQTDFTAVVTKMTAEKPDAIFYAGYYPEAGPLAQQLDAAGVTAKFVGPDGVKNDEFIRAAGKAAANAYFTCPCVPEDNFRDFTVAYRSMEGHAPGTYSAEAYDAATILLKGIDKGIADRAGLLDFVRTYSGQGLTKRFRWDKNGEPEEAPVWSYRVENGKIVTNVQIS